MLDSHFRAPRAGTRCAERSRLTWGVALGALAAAVALGSSPASAQSSGSTEYPVTVQSCGQDVTFDAPPQRAIVQKENQVDNVLLLGIQDRVVGWAGEDIEPRPEFQEAFAAIPRISDGVISREVAVDMDIDVLVTNRPFRGLEPDILETFGILSLNATRYCAESPKAGGSATAYIDSMFDDLLRLGVVFDVQDRAEAVVQQHKARLADIEHAIAGRQQPRVAIVAYYSGAGGQLSMFGEDSLEHEIIVAAGGENAAADLQGANYQNVGPEILLSANPDAIVVVQGLGSVPEDVFEYLHNDPLYADLPAVRDDRFTYLTTGEVGNLRFVEGVERLAQVFHPEAFEAP